jgi:CHAT domain-containing protein
MFPILRLFLKSFRRMTRRLSLTLVLIIGLGATPATAQITPNGLGTQVNRDGNTFNIHGGTQAGRNLFHSFYQFGLNQGQIANFWSNPAIANILARVNGGSASYINGLIQVLGGRSNLFLMNPSGIVFGPNASLNVPAAFTATTADRILFPGGSFHAYGENNFANLAGDPIGFAFDRKDPAAIVNEANLTATSVSLVAGQVINTGKVTANQITIAAVPGENLVRLSQAGQILSLEFNPQQAASVADASGNIPITRLPELLTGGGVTTVTVNPDQTVTLAGVAVPMSSGSALIGGVLDASNAVANGGQVGVFGTNISLVNAEINASGLTGGGEILIGGEFQGKGTQPNALNTWVNSGSILRADAVQVGNGGRIIVWADGTTKFAGSISAKGGQLGGDGGFAEVSGKETLNLAPGWSSRIDLSAPAGKRGTLLLDPSDIIISGTVGSGDLLDADIAAFLENNGDLTIQTTGSGGSGIITITGDVDITWSAATTFTLNADQSIIVNSGAVIENTNATTGFDAIVANAAGTTSGNFKGIELNGATLKANGGNIKLTGKGGDTGSGNYGIYQHSGAQVSTTSGNITYTGTGGNGTNDNVGVFLSGSGTKISSDGGAISITGTGQGTGFNNYGIIQQDSAQVSTTIGNITYTGTGAGTDDAIRTELGSNIIGDNTSGKITLTSTNNGITLNNVTVKTTNNITINSPGNVTQNNIGGLFADGLELLGSGSYTLDNTSNNINTLAANTSNFIKYTDTDGFTIGTVNTVGVNTGGNNLTLEAVSGTVTQSEAITASGLELLGGGSYDLTNTANNISTLAANTSNFIKYTDTDGFAIGTVNTVGINTNNNNLTLKSNSTTDAITFTQNVTTGTGNLTVEAGTIDQTGGVITTTGTASFTATKANTGNVVAKNVNAGGTVLGDSEIGGDFTLTSTGNVTQAVGATLKVAGKTTITAPGATITNLGNVLPYYIDPAGNVTIENVGTIDLPAQTVTGNLSVTALASGNAYASVFSGSAINLNQANSFGGTVSFNTQTASYGATSGTPKIIQSGAQTVAGTSTFNAVGAGGTITLNDVGNAFSGAVTLNTGIIGGDISFTNNGTTLLGNVTAGNNVTLNSSGATSQVAGTAITASGLELLGAGSYDLTNTANNISTLAANTTNDIKYTDANGFDIGTVNATNGISAPGKDVTLTAGGAVTQTKVVTANTLTLTGTGAGNFDLSTQNNDVNKLTATTVNQDVKFKDSNGFSVGDGTTGIAVGTGNVTLEASGLVDQNKAITANILTLTGTGTGSFDLSTQNNDVNKLTATTVNQDVKFKDSNGFTVGDGTTGIAVGTGNVTLEASGLVDQNKAITANVLTLTGTGAGSFDLSTQSNDVNKLTATTVNQDVKFKDSNGFTVGDGTTGIAVGTGNVTLEASGLVDQNKAITANVLTLIGTGTGSFDLSTQNNDVNKLTATTVNQDVKFKDSNGFTVGDGTTGIAVGTGNVTLEASGLVDQNKAITANVLTLTGTGAGSFDLSTQSNDVNKLTATTVNQDVKFKDSNGFTVGDGTTGIAVGTGNVTLEASGLVDQNKAITANVLTLIGTGAGSFDLSTQNNDVNKLTATTVNQDVKFKDSNGFSVGDGTTGIAVGTGNVTLEASGLVDQNKAITANVLTLTGTGAGSFDLSTQNNDVNKLTATTVNQDVKFKDSNGFTVGDGTTGIAVGTGNVTLEASGLVDQNKAITANVLTLIGTGAGSFDLSTQNNDVNKLTATTVNQDVKFKDSNGFNVGDGTTGIAVGTGNVTLEASGLVDQNQGITANTLTLTGTGAGSFDLSTQNNDVNKLTATTVNQDVKFKDSNGFSVGDGTTGIAVGTGNVTLEASGLVDQNQGITANTLTLTGTGAGSFDLSTQNNDVNKLTATTVNQDVKFKDSNGFSVGDGTTGIAVGTGNVTLEASGLVDQNQGITANTLTLTGTGAGSFDLSTQNNDVNKLTATTVNQDVKFKDSNGFSVGDGTTGIVVGTGNVTLESGGAVDQNKAITANILTLTGTGTGSFDLSTQNNDVNKLTATTVNQDVKFKDSNGFSVGDGTTGIVVGTGNVTLESGGAVDQNKAITANILTLIGTGTGSFDLSTQSNDVNKLTATTVNQDVKFKDSNGFSVGDGTTGIVVGTGNVTLESGGAVDQNKAITANILTLTGTGTGSFDLSTQNNDVNKLTATTVNQDVKFKDSNGFSVGDGTTGIAVGTGNVTLEASGLVDQNQGITANTLTLTGTGAGSFDLSTQNNDVNKLTATTVNQDVKFKDSNGFSVGDGTTGIVVGTGNVTLEASGLVDQNKAITANVLTLTGTGAGSFDLSTQNNDVNKLTATTVNQDVKFKDSNGFSVGDGTTGIAVGTGNVTLEASGLVDQNKAITANVLTLIGTGAGSFDLSTQNNDVNKLTATTVNQDVKFKDSNGFNVGDGTTGIAVGTGNVTLEASGLVDQNQGITANTLTLTGTGAGSFDLSTQNNDVNKLTATTVNQDVKFKDSNGFSVGDGTTGIVVGTGNVTLESGGAVDQNKAITANILTLIGTGTGSFDLSTQSNDVNKLTATTVNQDVKFKDSNGFTVGDGTTGIAVGTGNVTLEASGLVDQNKAITANVLTLTGTGAGSFDLSTQSNDVNKLTATTVNQDVKFKDSNGFSVGDGTTGIAVGTGNVTLEASGLVDQNKAITANVLTLTGTGAGSFDLSTQNNDVNKLTATTVNQDVKFKDSNGFSVGDGTTGIVVGTGNVTLEASGLVDQNKAITANVLTLTGTGTGSFDLSTQNNDVNKLTATTVNQDVKFKDSNGFSVGDGTTGIVVGTGNVTLESGGAVDQNKAITANILTLTGTGTGSFDLSTQNNDVNKLTATTVNQDVKFKDSNGFSVGDGTTGIVVGTGNVTLEASGLVDQNKAITANILTLTGTGTGSFDLSTQNNDVNKLTATTVNQDVKFKDSNGFSVGDGTTGIVVGTGNVTLEASGLVDQNKAITANVLTLTGTGTGSFDLSTQNNDVNKLTATTVNQDVKFKDSNGFSVGDGTTGIVVGTGNVTLESGGAVDQNKAITANILTLTGTGTGSFDLSTQNNDVNKLTATTVNQDVKFKDSNGFSVGDGTTGIVVGTGNVTLESGGAVDQNKAITANILTLIGTGTGSFDLSTQSNDVNKLTATTVNQDVKFKDSNGFTVGDGTTGIAVGTGNVTLEASGLVDQNQGITANTLTLTGTGAGSFDLSTQSNDVNKLTATTVNQDVKFKDSNGFTVGDGTTGIAVGTGNVTLEASGLVDQNKAITANVLTLTGTGAGSFDLSTQSNDVNKLTATTVNQDVKFKDSNGFTVGDGTTGIAVGTGNVTLEASGLVDQNKAITANILTLTGTVTGSFDLSTQNNDVNKLTATTVNQDVKFKDSNGFTVGDGTTGIAVGTGNVTLESGGGVTQTQKITASGLELLGSGSYTLDNTSNNINTLAANTTNDIKYTDTNGFVVGTVNTTNGISAPGKNVTLTAGGAVTQTQKITTGGLELSGSGNYTFANVSNNVQTLTVKTTGNVNYQDADALSFNTVGTVGGLDLDAVGTITQTSNVNSTGKVDIASSAGSIFAGGQNITITSANNPIFLTATNGTVIVGNLTTQNGQVGVTTSTGLIQVGNVKTQGGQISLISPASIKTGILDSSGGSGNISITGNGVQVDHIIGGSGSLNILSFGGFKATGQNAGGFSIQTNGGLIDIQYAPSGIFKVGSAVGNGTQGSITNGLITLSPNLTFQCFPTDCGVFKNVSIRPTESTSQKASKLSDQVSKLSPQLNALTFSEISTRQILDVSEVLKTQLDVATEEVIFFLDVAFGAEFANYLGVKPANTLRSAADVRKLLEDIYKQTGRKTAIIYWVLDQLYLNIVLITPGVPQGIAQKQGIVVASVDLTTGLVQQPTTAPLIYRGVPTARRDEVLRVINRFRSQVTDRRSRDYLKDAQALYRWLIEPIEPELQAQGIDTLLVVPDKGIRLLPLGALYDGKQFLIEKYNVAMTPSVNLISTRYRPLQGAEVLAMGASTFADERSLPSVPIELKTITSIWPGRYFLNQDFTPERLVQERKTGQFRIVHLATHATFKPGDLSESYIVFGNNQKLPVTKLPELSLKGVELFSLGACRTLIGDTTDPTVEFGFAGLAVKTGVETAVASLWNVEDTPTMALMTEFYRYLQKTPIKAEALRQAQLALMQGQTRIEIEGGQLRLVTRSGQSIPLPPELANIRDLDFSHPYFWSGFSMIGSPW